MRHTACVRSQIPQLPWPRTSGRANGVILPTRVSPARQSRVGARVKPHWPGPTISQFPIETETSRVLRIFTRQSLMSKMSRRGASPFASGTTISSSLGNETRRESLWIVSPKQRRHCQTYPRKRRQKSFRCRATC